MYPLRQFVVEWATIAICMHDMKSVYQGKFRLGTNPERPFMRVDFEQDPLSAVLCLADFLQDFERHHALFRPPQQGSSDDVVHFEFVPLCQKVVLKMKSPQTMMIRFRHENYSSARSKNHHLIHEHQELFSNVGYLNFSSLGIHEFDIQAE